jgi:hypothetical protein
VSFCRLRTGVPAIKPGLATQKNRENCGLTPFFK